MLLNYAPILDVCEPFLIAHPGIRDALNIAPAGVAIPPENILDPLKQQHVELYKQLRNLDQLTFGPFGMQMPSWVFYDCAVIPGAFFGLAMRASKLEPWALEALRLPEGYTGLVPVSQFIAIPMLGGFESGGACGHWLMYSAESINQVSPGMAPAGLLKLTLALGLRVFPVARLYGTTQWRSHKLSTYVDMGPFELVTAYTPAHSLPRTLSFRLDVEETHLLTLLAGPRTNPHARPPNDWVDPDDVDALVQLQMAIESGERVQVVGPPVHYGSRVRVPLHRCTDAGESRS